MTETRDRQSKPDDASTSTPWEERQLFGNARGLPWWGSIVLAFGLAVVGAFVDLKTQNTLGRVFQGAYFVGCVGAICLVRRRSLFGPMVQPPLILGITVPLVVLLGGPALTGGLKTKVLAVSAPLINGFPTMAITTVITVGVGVARIYLQRKPGTEKRAKGAPRKPPQRQDKRPNVARQARQRGEERSTGAPTSAGTGRPPGSSRSSATGRREPQAGTGRKEPPASAARRTSDSQPRRQDPRRQTEHGTARGVSAERARQPRPVRAEPPADPWSKPRRRRRRED
ncbi:MAG: DUF6542 domain-containing protein [Sciscionella sp.]